MNKKKHVSSPPADTTLQTDFSTKMSYTDYLSLDEILSAAHPRTQNHDEMLFIIQHQTSELWMSLVIHELDAARRHIKKDEFQPGLKMLSRVAKIFEQLNNAWDVLRTMTPSEYTAFREALGYSSGFQSFQYRMIEFMVGNRTIALLKPHAHREDLTAKLNNELSIPSLYMEVIHALKRANFNVEVRAIEDDHSKPHEYCSTLQDAWHDIYKNPDKYWTFYELAEKLIDFEDYFRRWRFNHLTTVERVIGFKRGTGGSEGVAYLKKALEVELFPELWRVRTVL